MTAPDQPTMNPEDPVDPASETASTAALPPEGRDAAGQVPVDDAPVPPPGPHEAKAGSYYRNVRYVITAAVVVMGCWFLYDGFVKYPAHSERYAELQEQADVAEREGRDSDRVAALEQIKEEGVKDHGDLSILLQKVLGMALPPLGIVLLVRWLHISRGTIRLDENDVLHVPGHPAVPASSVTNIDDGQWERKGISRVNYAVDGTSGSLKLDDFVYERAPIDAIHDRLVHLHKGA